jgi:hypothetical protein
MSASLCQLAWAQHEGDSDAAAAEKTTFEEWLDQLGESTKRTQGVNLSLAFNVYPDRYGNRQCQRPEAGKFDVVVLKSAACATQLLEVELRFALVERSYR